MEKEKIDNVVYVVLFQDIDEDSVDIIKVDRNLGSAINWCKTNAKEMSNRKEDPEVHMQVIDGGVGYAIATIHYKEDCLSWYRIYCMEIDG